VQYRNIHYNLGGFRNNPSLNISNTYRFVNPKAGITYHYSGTRMYASYSYAAKEPNRDDFEAGMDQQPRPEKMHDIEAGAEKKHNRWTLSANVYYMKYKDQLVPTGKINDVGAYTRINIPDSYRAGIELQASAYINRWLGASANLALSRNKVKNFTEYFDDYDNGGQKTNFYSSSDIAFSPAAVGGATITIRPVKNGEISFLSKYVSRQYLDNTSNIGRSIKGYFVQDARITYAIPNKLFKGLNFVLQANNVFNKKYEANGYTFSYQYGGSLVTENYYFPMAGTNIMAAVNIEL
jgi:iron complex outermembrane receptor protein